MNYFSRHHPYFCRGFRLVKLFLVLCLAATVMTGFSPGGREANAPPDKLPCLNSLSVSETSSGPPSLVEGRKPAAREFFSNLPLSFIENRGQLDRRILFYQQSPGQAISFTGKEIFFTLTRAPQPRPGASGADGRQTARVSLTPLGMQPEVEIIPLEPQPGKLHYYQGGETPQTHPNLSTYAAVLYRQAYPGIDLKFYGTDRTLEYDIIVHPGADPGQARFQYRGIKNLQVSPAGDLLIHLPQGGHLVQKRPVVYQEIAGQPVPRQGRFQVHRNGSTAAYSIQVAAYDPQYPLIIDPLLSLSYSNFLGGSGFDAANAIAVDGDGNMYVTGYTTSADFPGTTQGAAREDAFVAKFNADGSLAYVTLLSGSQDDRGYGIAVDSLGNAYVAGTATRGFPIIVPVGGNVFQPTFGGGVIDAFVAKLQPDGQVRWSSFLGGGSDDEALALAFWADGAGHPYVYLTGYTKSSSFPIAAPPGAATYQPNKSGDLNAFVTKIDANNTAPALIYSTFLGNAKATGDAIAVNSSGQAYVAGYTLSDNHPTLYTLQPPPTNTNNPSGFVTRFTFDGSALLYSTYLGTNGDIRVTGIAVDKKNDDYAYVTGFTNSSTALPSQPFPINSYTGGYDAFVAKLQFSASSLTLGYLTYLGGTLGTNDDYGNAIAVDKDGYTYVTGSTFSTDFPLQYPIQPVPGGSSDVFVTKFDPNGARVFSTYLGGSAADAGQSIAVDLNGFNIYVTGSTASANFPLAHAAPHYGSGTGTDAFVARISILRGDIVINGGAPYTTSPQVTLTLSASAGITEMQFSDDGANWGTWEAFNPTRTYNLPSGDGNKTVYAQFRDAAGNVTDRVSDSIILDTTPPDGSIAINSTVPGFINTAAVTLTLTATDATSGVSQMCFSNESGPYSDWEAFALSKIWPLSDGDGPKTVNVKFKDVAGNVSDPISAAITLDTVAPAGTIAISSTAPGFTNTAAVTLSLTQSQTGGTAVQMRFKNESEAYTPWEPFNVSKAWTLSSGDGPKTVTVQFQDDALNTTTATAPITLDTTPPAGSIAINSTVPGFINTAAVTLTLAASDATSGVSQMCFSNESGSYSTWETFAASKSWTLSSGDGPKTVNVKFKDVAGNISGPFSASIILDTGAPAGTIAISSTAPGFTNTAAVTLSLTQSQGGGTAVQMRFKNETDAYTAWEPFNASKAWTLSSGDGPKTVTVQFQDAALNTTTASATITLDTVAPAGSVAISSTAPGFTSTAAVTLTLSATDATSGVSQMCFSNETGAYSTWETFSTSKNWTLSSGDGTKTVNVKYKDVAGNISGPFSATIILDTGAPAGTIAISSTAPGFTNTAAVTLSLTQSQTGGTAVQMRFKNENGSYSTWEPFNASKAWTLSAGDGPKTVTVQFQDAALNTTTASATITLDTVPPAGSLAISSTAPGFTSTAAVTLTLSATDATSGVSQMCFSNETGAYSTWETSAASKSWTLSSGDGSKTVNVKYKDVAGNISGPFSASIILDTGAPTGTIQINGGATLTKDPAVTLFLTASDANLPITMRFSNDGSTYTDWENLASTKSWTLSWGDGDKTVTAQFKDPAGNVFTTAATITLDTTHKITANVIGTGGTILPFTGTQVMPYASNLTLTIAAAPNYNIYDVTDNGVSLGPVASVTLNNITADHTILAFFKAKSIQISASPNPLKIAYLKTAKFQVQLSDNPYANVVVAVQWQTGNPNIKIQDGGNQTYNSSLNFTQTNWNVPQTVTLVSNQETGTTIIDRAIFQLSGNALTSSEVTAYWTQKPPGTTAPIIELLLND